MLIYEHKKILALALDGALLVGCLTGCGTAAASPEGTPPFGAATPQVSDTPVQIAVANTESAGVTTKVSDEELFKPYEQFGLIYDSSKKELQYQGKTVRWFEDYYTIPDGVYVWWIYELTKSYMNNNIKHVVILAGSILSEAILHGTVLGVVYFLAGKCREGKLLK